MDKKTQSALKKRAILKTTRQMLAEQGGSQLTMRKLADAAGVRLSNIQYHFGSRDILLQALLTDFLEEARSSMDRFNGTTTGDLEKDLCILFKAVIDGLDKDNASAVFKELWAECQHSKPMSSAMTDYYTGLSEFYSSLLSELTGQTARSKQIKAAVTVLMPLLEGHCITGNPWGQSNKQVAQIWAKTICSVLRNDA